MSSKKRVLIIDDDPSILEAMDFTFKSFGFESLALPGPEDIVNTISQFNPGIIILDMLLSGADGREVCRDLKKDKKTASLPIILVSAHSDLRKSAQAAGADDYLEKPFDIDILIKKVERLLQ